jgi:predicted membrane-bound spermidine synthase
VELAAAPGRQQRQPLATASGHSHRYPTPTHPKQIVLASRLTALAILRLQVFHFDDRCNRGFMTEQATASRVERSVHVAVHAAPEERSSASSQSSVRLLRAIVFAGGLTSIGIELAASRLLAPYFGGSTFIWANLIGLTLTYLALGYYLGGRLADRYPSATLLYAITAIAGFFTGLIPVIARPILRTSLDAFDQVAVGAFYGSLIGTILLFAVPVTLLGFVTPFAIRLRMSNIESAGITAGNVYALSTVGSIAGSFLPVILLVPLVGTANTFLIFSAGLMAISIMALFGERATKLALASIALLAIMILTLTLTVSAQIKPPYRGELVYETESEYNYIQVLRDGDDLLLALNEGHAIHSIYNPNELLTGGPWDYFSIGPLFNDPSKTPRVDEALIIGLAGGTAARQLSAAYPGVHIDGVEIDPDIARIGEDYFGLDALSNLDIIVDDGRYFLNRTDKKYDLIAIDAYRQPYIPFQLTTKEFFQETDKHLSDEGVVVINVGRTETDYRLVDVVSSTMRAVFPNVYVIDTMDFDNSIVVATKQQTGKTNFERQIQDLPEGSLLKTVGAESLTSGNVRDVEPGGQVFTDDHAPVEWVVDQIIVGEARERNR